MNTRKYNSRVTFWAQFNVAVAAMFLFVFMAITGHAALGFICLCAIFATLKKASSKVCAVTLSVPEILTDVLDAFKLETPELFQPGGFAKDFTSKTAVLNDKITAKIAHVPVTGNYDR